MKHTLIILALLVTSGAATAQRRAVTDRPWNAGNLTLDDFRGHPAGSAEGSYADLRLGYSYATDTVDGIIVSYPTAEALMRPYHSWMMPGSRNEARLRYHQVQFDLLELERRRLELSMRLGEDYDDVLFDSALCQLEDDLAALRLSTDDGTNADSVEHWRQHTQERLAQLPVGGRLKYQLQWLFEMNFAAGFQCFTGSLNKDFTPGFTIDIMADIVWHRHMLALDISMGTLSARDTVWNQTDYFYTNLPVSDLLTMVEYGFRIVNNNRWSLTPFVGGGLHVLDQSEDNIRFSASAGTLGGGLLLQHRLLMGITPPAWGTAERYDLCITAKLTAAYSRFNKVDGKPEGWGIYLHVGAALGWGRYKTTSR